MPATDLDALLPDALTAVAAALGSEDAQLAWDTATRVLWAQGRTPTTGMADLYDQAVAIVQARAASEDPDAARWAASFVVEWEAHFPAAP